MSTPAVPGTPGAPGRSWSGTVDYGPGPLHAPDSVPALQALVARLGK